MVITDDENGLKMERCVLLVVLMWVGWELEVEVGRWEADC